MSGLFAWTRDKSLRFFYRFGIHCATHQIRLILISGLVITSLFYPALGIYSSSISPTIPNVSTRVLTSLFAPNVPSLSFFVDDLVDVWSDHSALRITEDPVARARCGMEKTIRIERVFVSSNSLDFDSGAISHRVFRSTLVLERRIAHRIAMDKLDCLTSASGQCIHLSPLVLWDHDENAISSDTDLIATINSDRNVTVAGVHVKPSMLLAGRESANTHGSSVDFAAFLVLTYFFNEDDCNGSTGHNAWIKVLRDASAGADLSTSPQEPHFSALEFNAEMKARRVSLITIILYLSYIIFFVYFSGSMRRMDTVHSRIGLCFTGLVEILVSTITSLSVCAIGGLRITLVPWGIFPLVIVFVGAENMFRLIDEVVKTRISLPVKERIGLGLSRAGTSNTAKVVSYNSILGIIAFFAHGAIRQFCVFAIVVLVAHWFLIHTFFVAVLSIDIQRLELGDLLRQDVANGSSGKRATGPRADADPKGSLLAKAIGGLRQVASGRVARNVSLLLLLVITATLYYTTLPPPTRVKDEPVSRASILRSKAEQAMFESNSDAHEIWRVFNSKNDPTVHLRIEYPSLITLDLKHDDVNARHGTNHRPRWSSRTIRFVSYITKVLILPIGITLTCLYGLLLYLLKGTDRLEMRREHEEPQSESEPSPIDGRASFKTLPLVFGTDIAHIASSGDGSLIASISVEGELYVWHEVSRSFTQVDTHELSLRSFSTSSISCPFSSLAVDEHGTTCVVGTVSGVVGVWYLRDESPQSLSHLYLRDCSSPVVQLAVWRSYGTLTSESEMSDASERVLGGSICVFAVYENNRIVKWVDGVSTDCWAERTDVVKAQLASLHETAYPLCLYSTADGGLEVLDVYSSVLHKGSVFLQAGSPEDIVVDAHISIMKVGGVEHALVAAATNSGILTIWDGNTGELIHTLEGGYGPVSSIQVIPMTSKACPQCGEEPLCTFTLVHSIGHVVSMDRGILARRCSCPITQPIISKVNSAKDSPMGRRSRSGSFVSSSGMDLSTRTRSRHTSVSNDTLSSDVSAFPVSGHGVHSRRGSERDLRRASEKLEKVSSHPFDENSDADDLRGLSVPDPSRRLSYTSDSTSPLIWRNFRLVRLKETTCERGGWGVLRRKVLGLRRKPRSRQNQGKQLNVHSQTLPSSVLDRWEAWTIDAVTPDAPLQASSLSTFKRVDACKSNDSEGRHLSRLAFTRLYPLVVRDTLVIAGFGNSVGILDFSSM